MEMLFTNDDGIHAEGLWALYHHFSQRHSVTVVAPDRERSGVGHGISLDTPLRASRVKVKGGCEGYAVNGTPADCIKLGVLEILRRKPDLVISGINPGENVGVNLNYSGTVAGAKEAALYGIPAIAASIRRGESTNYADAVCLLQVMMGKASVAGMPFGTFLNINIPNIPMDSMRGIVISRQGIERHAETFDKRIDPRNRTYYWQGRDPEPALHMPDTDVTALREDYVSITPIRCDMTDYAMVEALRTDAIDKMVLRGH